MNEYGTQLSILECTTRGLNSASLAEILHIVYSILLVTVS